MEQKFKEATESEFRVVIDQSVLETWQIIWDGNKPVALKTDTMIFEDGELETSPFIKATFYRSTENRPEFKKRIVIECCYPERYIGTISANVCEYDFNQWTIMQTFTVESTDKNSNVLSIGQNLRGTFIQGSNLFDVIISRPSTDKIEMRGFKELDFDIIYTAGKSRLYGKTNLELEKVFYILLRNDGGEHRRATGELRTEVGGQFKSVRQIVGKLFFPLESLVK
jgi:hypothetical protein